MNGRAGLASVFTSVVLIMICGLTAVYGAAITWATVEVRRLYGEFPEPSQAGSPPLNLVETVRSRTQLWSELPGAQGPAHELRVEAAALATNSSALAQLEESLSAHLAIEPTSSLSWVRLARVRAQLDHPMAAIEQAFEMSVLTGRFEADSMVQRILLALPLWGHFSENLKRTVRNEISVVAQSLSTSEHQHIRAVVDALPEHQRTELRALFKDAARPLLAGR